MATLEQVRAEAAQLSDDEREILMLELAASLEPSSQQEYDRDWEEEIRRRLRELDEGRAETIPWEEVRERLLARLDELKQGQST
jgi:putative addiction module component (TIGR02574 family)